MTTTPSENSTQQLTEVLVDKIRKQLASQNRLNLRRLLVRHNFADLAEVFETHMETEEIGQCFQMMAPGQAALVLNSLEANLQEELLSSMAPARASIILRMMPVDDAVDLIQRLEPDVRRLVMEELPFDSETRDLHHLLMEDPDSAAGIMSTEFIKMPVDSTIGEILREVRRADERDFVYYCYLVDKDGKLRGVVSLKTLIIHDDSIPVSRIASFDVKSILISFDQELVANLFRKYYNLMAMPVVDANEVIRGIITLDDIVEVIDEESTEDIYQTSGINLEDTDEQDFLTGSVFHAVKARLPWLAITLSGQFLIATIYSFYGKTVSHAIFACAFLPMLCGLSGNMGSQSVTIAVRELALNSIRDTNITDKVIREIKVAASIGLVFSSTVALVSFVLYHHMSLSILLAGCIMGFLLFSAGLGILLPYTIQRYFKLDPAGIVGPFITTFMDLTIYSVYLYLVTLLMDTLI